MHQPSDSPSAQHFSFQLSVIIPVYNAEAYLPETLESLARQSMDKRDFEVICVDDGSTDGSNTLCTAFAARHPNVTVLSQPNKGVCAARNAALDVAKGKYIFFLDSDDTISDNALLDISRFFDRHADQTDVVTCLILYGGTRPHKRFEILVHEGVYCLDEHPQIVQTTPNVAVKNTGLRFDPELYLAEDQFFTASNVARLGTIGYVPSAIYKYRRHEGSVSRVLNHPSLCFDNIVLFFSKLLALAEKHPNIRAYLEHLLLYNICWRIKEDRLYSHAKGEREKERAYYTDILTHVDNAAIRNCPWLNERHKLFLLSLKNRGAVSCRVADGAVHLDPENAPSIALPDASLHIARLRLGEQGLEVTGSAFSGAVFFHGKLSLCALVNGQARDLPLCYCEDSPSRALPEAEIQHFFSFTAPVASVQTLEFQLFLDGKPVNASLQFAHLNQIFPKRGRLVHLGAKHSIVLRDNTFFIYKTHSLPILRARLAKPLLLHCVAPLALLLRGLGKLVFGRKRIWLYTDGGKEKGAAFLQVQHDALMQDGVERHYIHDGKAESALAPCCGDKAVRTIHPESGKHLLYFLFCEKLITSSAQTKDILPFSERHIFFQDLIRCESIFLADKICLQKRVSPLAGMQSPLVDKVLISSRLEENNYTQKLCIGAKRFIRTGSPHLDLIGPNSCGSVVHETGRASQQGILYQPEWRSYLFAQNEAAERIAIAYFLKGSFFSQIADFLHDKKLAAFLKKEDLSLDIALIPEFAPYRDKFASPCDRVRVVRAAERRPLADYSLLISDFSSLLFDFLYAEKPVLSFIPDRAEIDAGLNVNRGFYLQPESFFSHYTTSGASLAPLLADLYAAVLAAPQSAFPPAIALKKRVGFFSETADHRPATYEAIMKGSGL